MVQVALKMITSGRLLIMFYDQKRLISYSPTLSNSTSDQYLDHPIMKHYKYKITTQLMLYLLFYQRNLPMLLIRPT